MTDETPAMNQVGSILAMPNLAAAVESDPFRRFLDQIPIAIAIAELRDEERIIYVNPEFERVYGQPAAAVIGRAWTTLADQSDHIGAADKTTIDAAIVESKDFAGTFKVMRSEVESAVVDVYSNVIQENDGTPSYRLAALVEVSSHFDDRREEYERRMREKDVMLFEVQHRVKNNLQLIMALMRMEIRNARGKMDTAPFERLAGRIESVQVLYALLASHTDTDRIDLGVYLSEIAAAVLRSHAVEGIRLNLKVDAYPVSVNVAMPTGLVVNELLTNALKHAFVGRDGGTITLHSISDGHGCRVTVADDGVGLPPGVEWPERGRLSALIVQSLRENAKAQIETETSPETGLRVTITFAREGAAPTPAAH
jgi:PAS domain S-box-containing protein